MTDYIDREELIDELLVYKKLTNREGITFKRLAEIIEAQHSVDAVEVIRCRDCKYNENGNCNRLRWNEIKYRLGSMYMYVKDDDFCKWGEKK